MRAPELGPVTWRKSSRTTGNNNCIEVARFANAVRDSKDPLGTAFMFAPATWSAFLETVKRGELDH
ncbi:DUF397 domain-containing protein [Saccharopolyspora phatthalungensis]|uniref:DUF397 domain-containing protein n=1 Tax=Saccharopolyspora phatthalungensis TaxID=664693 RepID=A0A840Q6R5_9PSEU|nr:DUF397 domain-containing protein [Saccharopolyspora phatthalungensis]MBB5154095.1 hypothetical protein [Saccharopolyspora phatthalungensis]